MDIECHGQIDTENLIHILQLFFFISYNFSCLPTLNFYVDVEMSILFLKMQISKKRVKNDWISPGLSLS